LVSFIKGNLTYTKSIKGTSAKGGGNVTEEGESPVTKRGLCWNETGNPTITNVDDSHNEEGIGLGEFPNSLISGSGLNENTVYYVRAYAVNSHGTAYGNEISFNSGKTSGTEHAGGLVFYNNGDGGGLVCVKNPISPTHVWSSNDNTYITGTKVDIGTGKANTAAIISQTNPISGAAKVCDDYNENGYTDWFLPSYDEARLMLIRSNFAGWHWSSSDYEAEKALALTSTGDYLLYLKSHSGYVRPVREF
jgi:hypothetical protein